MFKLPKPLLSLLCLAAPLLLNLPSPAIASQEAAAPAPRIVTTIKPLQLIASAVSEGISVPELLIPANQSYHHHTLRPSAVRSVHDADLLVWIGPGLETYMAGLIEPLERVQAVVRVMDLPGLLRHEIGKTGTVGPAGGSAHDHAGHSHGQYDTHVWLDTRNAAVIAAAVAGQLMQIDPLNSERYQQNLAAFRAGLQDLQERTERALQPQRPVSYAVYHNAFQYFERQHGLQHRLALVEDEEMQPGVRRILALRQALQETSPVCLLEDVTAKPATVTTVLGDYTIARHRADTLGAAQSPGADGYLQMIDSLSGVFLRCLGSQGSPPLDSQ